MSWGLVKVQQKSVGTSQLSRQHQTMTNAPGLGKRLLLPVTPFIMVKGVLAVWKVSCSVRCKTVITMQRSVKIIVSITSLGCSINLTSCEYLFITSRKHILRMLNREFFFSEKGLPPFSNHCFKGHYFLWRLCWPDCSCFVTCETKVFCPVPFFWNDLLMTKAMGQLVAIGLGSEARSVFSTQPQDVFQVTVEPFLACVTCRVGGSSDSRVSVNPKAINGKGQRVNGRKSLLLPLSCNVLREPGKDNTCSPVSVGGFWKGDLTVLWLNNGSTANTEADRDELAQIASREPRSIKWPLGSVRSHSSSMSKGHRDCIA